MKPLALAPLLAAGALSLSSGTAFADSETETFSLEDVSLVEFRIEKSNITLIGSDRNDLLLTLAEPAYGFDPDTVERTVEYEENRLVIEIEYEKPVSRWWKFGSDEVKGYKSATLEVPLELAAKLKTSGGNISVESLQANLEVHTSGGHIKVGDVRGALDLHTSGGNVTLQHIEGATSARTSGGHITIDGLIGVADVRTSGGNIRIDAASPSIQARTSGGHIEATFEEVISSPSTLATSGGNIKVEFKQGFSAPLTLSTSGGNVKVETPESSAFDLLAKSNGGQVRLEHPGSFSGDRAPKRVEGSINGGGPLLKLSTSGGSVSVEET